MEHLPKDDVLQISISLYRNIGESITNDSSKILHLYRLFNVGVMIINLLAILANLFHVEGGMYIKTVEGSLTVVHALLKYSVFLYYKADIKRLLSDILYFWNDSNLTKTTNFSSNITRIYRYLKTAQNLYLLTSLFAITAMLLRPAFGSKSNYIFYCWVPNSVVLETLVLFCQYYLLSIVISITFACDSMYISYSVHVIVQVRLLKYKLKHLNVNGDIGKLYDCLKHHQFLLSIFERMNQVYFWMFLFHYFVTLITGCTQLYVIILGNADMIDLIATSTYIVALFVQFGFWSIPVEEIVFELNSISTALYMSKWYEENEIVKRILLTMMMKAQRQKYMSAGGLMEMNINAFGSVTRKIFSFYALLKNILD